MPRAKDLVEIGEVTLEAAIERVRAARERGLELELTLVYRAELQYVNVEEILDRLRETGSADVVAARLVRRPQPRRRK